MTTVFEVSDAFRTMCKVAVESGLSRKEMDNAVELAWLAKAQLERRRRESDTYAKV